MTFRSHLPHSLLRGAFSRTLMHLFALLALMLTLPASAAIPASERTVLINLYTSTNGAGWSTKTGWIGAAGTECTWYGVTCNGGGTHVTGIDLNTNNLTGPLPVISGLTTLITFRLFQNNLTGNIPSLTGLSALQGFFVRNNQLTGSLPSLTGLNALQQFSASSNQLTGNIPPLTGLTALNDFSVENNQLTGSIPALTGLTALSVFSVYNNQLTGSIPALTGLGALTSFSVENNQLTGSIPAVPSPVNALLQGQSALCPNQLTVSVNTAWDTATDSTPWSSLCTAVATLPTVAIGNVSLIEGNAGTSVMNFPVTLSAPAPAGGVQITYSTVDGTATAGSGDYVSVINGTATIAAGSTSGFLPVTINGDAAIEGSETFTVQMISATNATLGQGTTNPINIGTGTILNDDTFVAAQATPVPVNSLWLLLAATLGVIALRRKLR